MTRIRSRCPKDIRAYSELWTIVDGAVSDAFKMHPDYLAPKRRRAAQNSVTKRVVGAVFGFANQSFAGQLAKGRRSVSVASADKALLLSGGNAPGSPTRTGGRDPVQEDRGSLAAGRNGGERFSGAGVAP